jgi:hypothetical protein
MNEFNLVTKSAQGLLSITIVMAIASVFQFGYLI